MSVNSALLQFTEKISQTRTAGPGLTLHGRGKWGIVSMWIYEKKLEFPVKIRNSNPQAAKIIISQLGGPDGETGAATRYLNQRYSMPNRRVIGILTDVGTEELAHMEIVSAILYQLTRNLSPEEIKRSGFDTYFVDHTTGVYPQAASGMPFSASTLQVTGDVFADLHEDLAADGATLYRQHLVLPRGLGRRFD